MSHRNMPDMLASAHLLPLLRDVSHARSMSLTDWDSTLRLARQARLLGVLAHRLRADALTWDMLPLPVLGHVRSALNYSAYRAQLVRIELAAVDKHLPAGVPVVLLKGAAYLMQGLPAALGRTPNDVDLMVARERLDEVEQALVSAGWESEVVDDYDQRYYREWSHELPPMRKPGHALELDLHHTIAPVTSRTRANDDLLREGLIGLPASAFYVLHPCDQIIHAAIHLFQDSELDGRLRELVDLDALIRSHLHQMEDWRQLLDRARVHRAQTVLWYGLHFAREWLATPVPDMALADAPSPRALRVMTWMLSHASLPRIPDGAAPLSVRLAMMLARVRYHRMRMSAGLMLRHMWQKFIVRRVSRGRRQP